MLTKIKLIKVRFFQRIHPFNFRYLFLEGKNRIPQPGISQGNTASTAVLLNMALPPTAA